MKKHNVLCTYSNGDHHDFYCDTLTEANEWIAKQEAKKLPWGQKPDRWLLEDEFDDETIETSTDAKEIELVDLPDEVTYKTQYFFPKKYSYEIVDLTNDVEYIKQKKDKELSDLGFHRDAFINALMEKELNGNSKPLTDLKKIKTDYDGAI